MGASVLKYFECRLVASKQRRPSKYLVLLDRRSAVFFYLVAICDNRQPKGFVLQESLHSSKSDRGLSTSRNNMLLHHL